MSAPTLRRFIRAPQRGFTLIELMIVVAALGVLTTIAAPSYVDYIKRGRMTEAFNTLSSYTLALEQYYQDNRTYVGACTANPPTSGNFTYGCTLGATTYTLTATGATSSMNGFVFTLDQAGSRATTGAPSGWTASAACWIDRKSGPCQTF